MTPTTQVPSQATQPSPDDQRWHAEFAAQAYAFGQPDVLGKVKLSPHDFKVTELMARVPSGEGEHYWLDISKTCHNTDQVAKALARFANVAYRDVGYSGLKDFYAVTRQWFSVWVPQPEKRAKLDWSEFTMDHVELHSIQLHHRKLKRSTHKANQFDIVVRNLAFRESLTDSQPVTKNLEDRMMKVVAQGVPNYFGSQRFGRDFDNMNQALDMLNNNKRVKNRNLRSLFISSARSWLFNRIVSARVNDGSWQRLQSNEPANLNGSNSYFMTDDSDQPQEELESRLLSMDIHPTGPMWGDGASQYIMAGDSSDNAVDSSLDHSLFNWERSVLDPYHDLCKGLERARVPYQRRALRISPQGLQWSFVDNDLSLSFSLPPGQFATSVLREIVYFDA